MLGPTKAHLTDETVELNFTGPLLHKEKAIHALRKLGFIEDSDSIPWREAFPEIRDEDLPSICLRGSRKMRDLTQQQLSKHTGIPLRHISEMENGKRPIGKKNARIFAKALNVSYQIFL